MLALPLPPAEDLAMKLWYAPNTRAVRIKWLLDELGLAHEIERLKLGDPAMRSAEFREVHPLGRVPVLEDGPVRMIESGAIVQYLLATYDAAHRLHPAPGAADFPDYLQWLHFAEGMLMPPVNTIVVETILLPPERRNDENVSRAQKLLGRMLEAVDRALEGRDHLAGGFSGADVMTGHACIVSTRLGGADLSALPHLAAYIARLEARPALASAWDA
ncbi:MAG: glutathione S-transferase family protein [Pseudomonadota bacterium]